MVEVSLESDQVGFEAAVGKNGNEIAQLFKSFKFGNGSRMSDKKLVILEFKYLQNTKWQKQAVKSTRRRKSYRTY